MPRTTLEDRAEFVDEPGPLATPCRISQRRIDRCGYTQVWIDGRRVCTHVVEWERLNGPKPPGHDLHHLCENRRCANPEHLELLDRTEHVQRHAKLTWPIVRHIRAELAKGVSQQTLGEIYGVTQAHISRIGAGERWREKPR